MQRLFKNVLSNTKHVIFKILNPIQIIQIKRKFASVNWTCSFPQRQYVLIIKLPLLGTKIRYYTAKFVNFPVRLQHPVSKYKIRDSKYKAVKM